MGRCNERGGYARIAVRFVRAAALRHHRSPDHARADPIANDADIRRVIFSDLDGTLLDHDTYDWQPAAPVLDELVQRGIPVVLVSSKTLAELAVLRRALALPDPVIAENGAVIDVAGGYFPADVSATLNTVDRATLQRHLREIRAQGDYDCVSFDELGDAGIAAATGLTIELARLANRRQATEPILWNGSDAELAAFAAAAQARGLRCTRGGRFVHLMGAFDKADAVAMLCDAYRRKWLGSVVETIALGDGPNDLGMLSIADVAVVIPGRHGQPMPLDDHPRVLRPVTPGPVGWAASLRELLDAWGATHTTTTGANDG